MIIKEIPQEDMKKAIELVWRVFLEYEAPDYTEEGIKEFQKTISNEKWVEERKKKSKTLKLSEDEKKKS